MKVSIGIPFYNSEKYLAFAIQSVLNQSFTDFELLLLDDGSTDRSLQIARSFKDKRITVISDGQNKGLAIRLNELSVLSRGEYYARMDADDIMETDRIKHEVEYLESHPDVDVVGSWAYTIDVANRITGEIKYTPCPDSLEDVCRHRCFIHPSVMARRQWFVENPYNTEVLRIEDFELWSRTIKQYKFANLPQHLLFYRTVGLPYLSKYLQSNKGERQVLRHLKGIVSHRWKYILKSYLKCGLYIAFTLLSLQKQLVRRRSHSLSESALQQANQSLASALHK